MSALVFAVPQFTVFISTSSSPPYSEGSNVILNCSTELPPAVDAGVNVSVIWIRSGVTLATDDTPQLVKERYSSSYNIQKLNSSTSGEYNCSFVASGTTPFIRGSTASNTTNITLDIKSITPSSTSAQDSTTMPISVTTPFITQTTSDLDASILNNTFFASSSRSIASSKSDLDASSTILSSTFFASSSRSIAPSKSDLDASSTVTSMDTMSFTSFYSPLIQSTSDMYTPISVSLETTTMSTTSSVSSSSPIDGPTLSPSMSSNNFTMPIAGGLSISDPGPIAGVVIGVIAALAILAAISLLLLLLLVAALRRRKKKRFVLQ